MDKNNMIKKIKFMEMALGEEEKLNLLCRPSYDCWGGYSGLELFFMSDNMTENAIISGNNYYMVLSYQEIKEKKYQISKYTDSFCHCPLDLDFEDECTCKLPSKEEAEEWWYNNLMEKLKNRSSEIKDKINEN